MSKKHKLNRGRLGAILFSTVALFGLTNLIGIILEDINPNSWVAEYSYWIDLDKEGNLPTIFTSLLLLSSALLALTIAFRSKANLKRLFWGLFSVLFFYLSADELFVIHERFSEPIRDTLNINEGIFFHAWVIPAFIVAGITAIGLVYLTVFGVKNKLINKDLIIYFLVLIAGVSLIETVGTLFYENTVVYRTVLVPIEELYEMTLISLILLKVLEEKQRLA